MTRYSYPVLVLSLFLLMLTLACNSSGSGSPSDGTDSLATTSDTNSIDGKLKYYDEMIRQAPSDWSLLSERSLVHYQSGNTQAAIADIDQALVINFEAPELYHLRGFYAYVQNDDEVALSNFKLAADFGSLDPETFYMMGQIHFLRNQYEEADKYYDTAIEIDSVQPTYVFAKGFLRQKQGKYDAALTYYDQSLEIDPGFIKSLAQMYNLHGDILGDQAKAMEINDRILSLDSLHPIGHFNQGNFFLGQAQSVTDPTEDEQFGFLLKLAISEYAISLLADPSFTQAYYNRGYCFYLLDDFNNAVPDLDKVLEIDPFNDKAHFLKASILEFYGDLEGALTHFEEAFKLNPGFKDAEQAIEEVKGKLKKS